MVVPNEWEIRPLQELVDIISGGTPLTTVSKYWDGNIIWVVPTDITNQRRKYINTSERKITEFGLANSAAVLLPIGTVLLCSRATIGELAIAVQPMTTNQGFKNLVCSADIDNEFLYYALQSLKSKMIEQATGSTFLEISKTALGNIKVLTPPITEQHTIATTLSDTDSYITALEKLIAKKQAVKQGAMQELLTGKRMAKVELGSVADIYRGGSPRPIQSYLTTRIDGVNWIKIGDVLPNTKYINATEERIILEGVSYSRLVNKGDFILSNSMSFGRPYILNIEGCIHDGWLTIQNYHNSFDTDFLYYVLSSEDTMQQYVSMAAGSSVQNLSKEKVSKVVVPCPTLAEQTTIAQILSDMDSEINALTVKLNKVRNIKQGMMSELLTGRIRLVDEKIVANENILEFPKQELTAKETHHKHSEGFDETVILVALVKTFGTEKYPFTAFDCQKFPYLFHRHLEGVTKGYKKFAAGPYNPSLKYETAIPIALGQDYIRKCVGKYKGYVISNNAEKALSYFLEWYGDKPLKWLEQFRFIKNRGEELELLTTVDMAMVELRQNNIPITVSTVKEVLEKSKEWKAKLKREIFSDANIDRAIKWSDRLFGDIDNAKD